MTDKVIHMDRADEPDWLGGHNDPPPNLVEITEAELVANTKWGTYTPKMLGFAQVHAEKMGGEGRRLISLHMFIYHDGTGVAYSTDWTAAYHLTEGRPTTAAPMTWYRFARCVHEMTRTNIGNCFNRYDCKLCGYSEEVDSSG